MVISRIHTKVAAVVAVATFLVLASSVSAIGYWTAGSSSISGSASSPTIGIDVTGDLNYTYVATSSGTTYTANSVDRNLVTVKNTGSAAIATGWTLKIARNGTSTMAATDIDVWITPATACTGNPTGTSTLLSNTPTYTGTSALAGGASTTFCVSTRYHGPFPATTSISITTTAAGDMGSGVWPSTDAFTSTQNARFQVTCENGGSADYGFSIAWPTYSGAGTVTYIVRKINNGATTVVSSSATSGGYYVYSQLGAIFSGGTAIGAAQFVNVTISVVQGGVTTTSTSNNIPITVTGYNNISNTVRCDPEGTC